MKFLCLTLLLVFTSEINGQFEFNFWTRFYPTITCSPAHSDPTNGAVTCTSLNYLSSECTFSCNPNFKIDGWNKSVCEDDGNGDEHGLWSSLPPVCRPITCSPAKLTPTNGFVTCSKSNNLNSVCTFSCNGNFALVGSEVSVCNDDGNGDQHGVWSKLAPVCRPITCSPAHSTPGDGVISCSNSNNLNSACKFKCRLNCALVGSTQSVCNDDGNGDEHGLWSSLTPVCRPITCSPAHSRPGNGSISCSNSNNLNSACKFKCNPNFALIGSTQSVCNDDGNGDEHGLWSSLPPVCRPITCSPAHSRPGDGVISCSNSNNLNSACKFKCNPNFALIGLTLSVCNDDGNGDEHGLWTSLPPVCRPITCSPAHSTPGDGVISCTNSNNLNSACKFKCNPNFALAGSTLSVCNDDGNGDEHGLWSSLTPVCRPITCSRAHSHPTNGYVTCTKSNNLNSVCTFSCHGNFRLVGSTQSACRHGGWSNLPAPVCERKAITCSPVHSNPTNGYVTCTKSNNLNSVCTFSCHGNFSLVGSTQSVCRQGGWSNLPAPVCRRKANPTPRPVWCEYDDGDSCTSQDGTNFYKIRKAKGCPDNRVKCTKPEIGAALFQSNLLGPQAFQHGSSSSSGGGAQAPASSGKGVTLLGRNLFFAAPTFVPTTTAAKQQKSSCSGIPDGKGGFAFGSCNERIPLIRKNRMVSNKKRDLVLLLDESGSVGKKRFENVKRIAAAIVKLLCGDIRYHKIYTRITVISFDQQVHFHIPLNKYLPSAADLAEFIRKKIIYDNTTAGRTCLGKTLDFVYDVALTVGGRRGSPDTEQNIIIITDGCSNCGYKNFNADQTIDYFVNKFKHAGIHVYVIGIGLTGHQANCKDKLSVLATGGRCYHFFYLDRWEYDVELFIQQLEKPPNGACVNVFEHPSGQCFPSGR